MIKQSTNRALGVVAGVALALGIVTSASAGMTEPGDVMMKEGMVAMSLIGTPGDTAVGKKAFVNRKLGNCLACHVNSDMASQPYHGEVGPSLDGVADRYSESELRAILVNSKTVLGEGTIMPSFYTVHTDQRVAKKFKGKTVLSAEQVEGILAYLLTLKE